MTPGPFLSTIMPVTVKYRYDDVNFKWKLFASRYIAVGTLGRKYEQFRESYDSYDVMLTAISHFIGND